MALAVLNSCAPVGMTSVLVRTEVHIGAGLPNFLLVGLASTGVKESRDRVRTAILSSGFEFPIGRITVNLSPADLPKDSGRFDLPIALGILIATGQARLSAKHYKHLIPHMYFVGELSLTGALTSIQAPLILALSIFKSDPKAILIMPKADASMAALVDGLTVIGANNLKDVVEHLEAKHIISASVNSTCSDLTIDDSEQFVGFSEDAEFCLSDVRGQEQACHLLELAASGGHSLLLSGPSGVGKTMLAQRLPTILPDLNPLERLELLAIQSVSANGIVALGVRPPWRSPHHSISDPALLGGGSQAYPGELSLAHHGVLFLDELAEFKRSTLEALRGPMEAGEICISRANSNQIYPAKFQFIAATNPCACGYLDHPEVDCVCTHRAINQYQSKISGPLLERIDIHYKVPPLNLSWADSSPAERSEVVRQRVLACRKRQYQRQGMLNADLKGAQINQLCSLNRQDQIQLELMVQQNAWSTRVVQSILKLARTSADMRGAEIIDASDLSLAISCRQPFSKKEEGRLYWHTVKNRSRLNR